VKSIPRSLFGPMSLMTVAALVTVALPIFITAPHAEAVQTGTCWYGLGNSSIEMPCKPGMTPGTVVGPGSETINVTVPGPPPAPFFGEGAFSAEDRLADYMAHRKDDPLTRQQRRCREYGVGCKTGQVGAPVDIILPIYIPTGPPEDDACPAEAKSAGYTIAKGIFDAFSFLYGAGKAWFDSIDSRGIDFNGGPGPEIPWAMGIGSVPTGAGLGDHIPLKIDWEATTPFSRTMPRSTSVIVNPRRNPNVVLGGWKDWITTDALAQHILNDEIDSIEFIPSGVLGVPDEVSVLLKADVDWLLFRYQQIALAGEGLGATPAMTASGNQAALPAPRPPSACKK